MELVFQELDPEPNFRFHFGGIRTVIAVEKTPEPKVLHKSQEPPSMVLDTSVGAVTQFGGLEMKVLILVRRKKTKNGSDFGTSSITKILYFWKARFWVPFLCEIRTGIRKLTKKILELRANQRLTDSA